MKNFLLSLLAILFIGFTNKVDAQCNLTADFIHWSNGMGTGIAPFAIGESPLARQDWEDHILNPSMAVIDITSTTPYNPPAASSANWSQDGIAGVDDLDAPQSQRDLRFFAFTYDDYNVYFYFRRINGGNAQNIFYFIMDVNADGFINDGEPVLRGNFNGNSVTDFEIHPYIIDGGIDFVTGKGNYLVDPGTGIADGYSVKGTVNSSPVDRSLLGVLGVNEIYAAAPTGDGYGMEFAVPWSYLRSWSGDPTLNTPLSAGDVFTYHVSSDNGAGTYTLFDASDNAGGCCSGLAAIGNAKYETETFTSTTLQPNLEYRLALKLENTGNAAAKISLDTISFSAIGQFNGQPIDEMDFVVKGYVDANCDGVLDPGELASEKLFTYLSGTFGAPPIRYISPFPRDTTSAAALGGFGCFIADVRFPANYSVKSATVNFRTTGVLDLPLGPCDKKGTGQVSVESIGVVTALPVAYTLFTATRNLSTVYLKWETAYEQNNNGFAIERNINGTWQQVGFIPSQSPSGNSESLLAYTFNDLNTSKGISQYRIKQIDFDAKVKYSDIKAVRGIGQTGKTIIYPNPSNSGTINLVFEDANVTRDIAIIDMSGRIIQQKRAVTNNNIRIENLSPGIYMVQVTEPEMGARSVYKVVVYNR